MKQLFLSLLFLFSLFNFAANPLRIGVISDMHLLAPHLMDDGEALSTYMRNSGKNIVAAPLVLDSTLRYFENVLKPDVLLVCGDITKDGERQSHLFFLDKIRNLQAPGTKVFVIPGNHDVNMPNSVGFSKNTTYPVDNISPLEFKTLYADCGYKDAVYSDKSSLSYVARMDSETWLLAVDAARYDEYATGSISAGRIKPETEKWIVEVLKDAKQRNKQVIAMMHWGLTEHIMFQSMAFPQYLVSDWERLSALFADNGVKAIFTGHFHSNDITMYESPADNVIYDIETASLAGYPFAYRCINYYSDKMEITTRNIQSVKGFSNLMETDRAAKLRLAKQLAAQKMATMGYELNDNVVEMTSQFIAQLFVLHAAGDEKVTDEMKDLVKHMKNSFDTTVDLETMELDFPPADNNIILKFK